MRQLELQERGDRMRERLSLPPPPPPAGEYEYSLLPSLAARIRAERRAQVPTQQVITVFTEAVRVLADTVESQHHRREPKEVIVIIETAQRRSERGMVPRKRRYGDV